MPREPVVIEVIDPPNRAFINELVRLSLVIRCPDDGKPVELQHIASQNERVAELESDLFERDLRMQPGEVYRCDVNARFSTLGHFQEPPFYIQASADEPTILWIPTPPIRVVPSLLGELLVTVDSICTYDLGTKLDVTLSHIGLTKFEELRLTVGPTQAVRSGVSEQRRPAIAPGEQVKFTTVLAAEEIELTLDAKANGEQVGPVTIKVAVPPVRDTATTAPFRFLEPKKLTQADVKIFTLDEEAQPIPVQSGVHVVRGGGTKYRVEIKPSQSNTTGVTLRGISGFVETTPMPHGDGVWSFQMVVLSNTVFSTPAALHFDVQTPEGEQQGEVNLSIRPGNSKTWTVALTAGFALTAKGAVGLFSAIFGSDEPWSAIGETLTKSETLWEFAQLSSILVIRGFLWVADEIARPLQE